jgi:hypothetical protein
VTERTSTYLIAGTVRLRVHGPERLVRHFDAEYGEVAVGPAAGAVDVDLRLRRARTVDPLPGGSLVRGGHKSARWRVALGPPEARPLRASIALAGGPPSFALSLVQGYVVEALVALALQRRGRVALPSAGFAQGDGVTVLLGRSGAGKTTLTARALAAGRGVLSDDQVVIDGSGRAWRYPRRLRFYADIRETAPQAWTRLPARTRSALHLRGRVRALTRGYVAPSLAVPITDVGPGVLPGPLPVRRLVVVERGAAGSVETATQGLDWAVEQAALVIADQRVRLYRAAGQQWDQALDRALEEECRLLAAALADVPVSQVVLPRAWAARRSVDALDAHLGVTSSGAPPQ